MKWVLKYCVLMLVFNLRRLTLKLKIENDMYGYIERQPLLNKNKYLAPANTY